jgi:hypothetical protein
VKIEYETEITTKDHVEPILNSPATHKWVVEQYAHMSDRDCVDAYYDALTLVDMLRSRLPQNREIGRQL